jgi:hypothetical protein
MKRGHAAPIDMAHIQLQPKKDMGDLQSIVVTVAPKPISRPGTA